jgi:hypothetical protein
MLYKIIIYNLKSWTHTYYIMITLYNDGYILFLQTKTKKENKQAKSLQSTFSLWEGREVTDM